MWVNLHPCHRKGVAAVRGFFDAVGVEVSVFLNDLSNFEFLRLAFLVTVAICGSLQHRTAVVKTVSIGHAKTASSKRSSYFNLPKLVNSFFPNSRQYIVTLCLDKVPRIWDILSKNNKLVKIAKIIDYFQEKYRFVVFFNKKLPGIWIIFRNAVLPIITGDLIAGNSTNFVLVRFISLFNNKVF